MLVQAEKDETLDDIISVIPALRAYAWSLTRKQQEVDDLVQETLTKAIANVDRFTRGTNVRAWLMTIMRNTFYNEIVKRNRERPGGKDCVSDIPVSAGSQEWSYYGNEIMKVVRHLPACYRETLILVVMLGESYETTAQICGVEIGTVKSRVSRARRMILEELGEEEFTRL